MRMSRITSGKVRQKCGRSAAELVTRVLVAFADLRQKTRARRLARGAALSTTDLSVLVAFADLRQKNPSEKVSDWDCTPQEHLRSS